MLIDLIATVAAGFGAGGVALLLRRMSGGRLPGWITPTAAGLAMIGYQIHADYDWRDGAEAALPDGVTVLREIETTAWWKPWTLVFPYVNRFSAVDVAAARTHPDAPGMKLAQIYLMAQRAPTIALPVLVDCVEGRWADIADSRFDADGMPQDPNWVEMPADDPMRAALCG